MRDWIGQMVEDADVMGEIDPGQRVEVLWLVDIQAGDLRAKSEQVGADYSFHHILDASVDSDDIGATLTKSDGVDAFEAPQLQDTFSCKSKVPVHIDDSRVGNVLRHVPLGSARDPSKGPSMTVDGVTFPGQQMVQPIEIFIGELVYVESRYATSE